MLDSLRHHHAELLAALFAITVVAVAWLEVFRPRRPVTASRAPRWTANLTLGAVNTVLFMLAVPLGAFAAAIVAEQHGWGVLRLMSLPAWLAIALGVLAIDLSGYVIHRLMHGVPALWRLHHVHHSDIDIDFTTTVRHHPVESLVTVVMVSMATIAWGVPPESVVLQLIAATLFDVTNHSNLTIPRGLDRWARRLVVTPDMHLAHHSSLKRETDSNYGTVLALWDRWLGTYVAVPAAGVAGMTIGLEYRRDPADQRLDRLLWSPFIKRPPAAPANRTAAAIPE